MNKKDIERILSYCGNATNGPWGRDLSKPRMIRTKADDANSQKHPGICNLDSGDNATDWLNYHFLVNARVDLPVLAEQCLELMDKLAGQNEQIEAERGVKNRLKLEKASRQLQWQQLKVKLAHDKVQKQAEAKKAQQEAEQERLAVIESLTQQNEALSAENQRVIAESTARQDEMAGALEQARADFQGQLEANTAAFEAQMQENARRFEEQVNKLCSEIEAERKQRAVEIETAERLLAEEKQGRANDRELAETLLAEETQRRQEILERAETQARLLNHKKARPTGVCDKLLDELSDVAGSLGTMSPIELEVDIDQQADDDVEELILVADEQEVEVVAEIQEHGDDCESGDADDAGGDELNFEDADARTEMIRAELEKIQQRQMNSKAATEISANEFVDQDSQAEVVEQAEQTI